MQRAAEAVVRNRAVAHDQVAVLVDPSRRAKHLGKVLARTVKRDIGAAALRSVKEEGPTRRLAAFVMEERAIPREGMAILDGSGEPVGAVTSGSHSPMLERGIGMGYVPTALAEPGTELTIDVRGRPRRGRLVKKPIYQREERNGG